MWLHWYSYKHLTERIYFTYTTIHLTSTERINTNHNKLGNKFYFKRVLQIFFDIAVVILKDVKLICVCVHYGYFFLFRRTKTFNKSLLIYYFERMVLDLMHSDRLTFAARIQGNQTNRKIKCR